MAEREWVTGPDLDAEIERVIFGHTEGIGYYGPPLDPAIAWAHELSVRYDSKKQATEAYRVYYEARHRGEHPQGIAIPGEYDHFGLCYWRDGWGPVAVPEYSEDVNDAMAIVDRFVELGWGFTLHCDYPDEQWRAEFFMAARSILCIDSGHSPALAICKAGLLVAEQGTAHP